MKKLFLLILITASTAFGLGETLLLQEQIKVDRIEMQGLSELQEKQCEYMLKMDGRMARQIVPNHAPFSMLKK